jgi:cytoskeletal protein CcmA (bactofilin family)
MFSKNDKQTSSGSTPAPAAQQRSGSSSGKSSTVPSLISPGLEIKGDMISDGDIQVDGKIEGDVQSKTLTIGESAVIVGEVSATTVIINGTVTGEVRGQTIVLGKTSRVLGDIVHETLSIEAGAQFEGQCRRLTAEQKSTGTDKPASTSGSSAGTSGASATSSSATTTPRPEAAVAKT